MMKQSTNKLNNSSGFSFVELMVVIAIVGILSAISLPSFFKSLPEKRLKGVARILYADLQKARLLAVKNNDNITVNFDTTAGSYSYLDDTGQLYLPPNDLSEILTEQGAGVVYGCNATSNNTWRESTETPDDTVPSNGVTDDITFTNTGTSNQQDIYLQSQNNQEVCYAVSTTSFGAVKIRRFNGSTWE